MIDILTPTKNLSAYYGIHYDYGSASPRGVVC